MITRLWLLTLLAAPLAHGFDHAIDLTRCKEETACFVRESCIKGKGQAPANQAKLVQYKGIPPEALNNDVCDVVMQIKALTNQKLHVMMEVKTSDSSKIKFDDGLKLIQGTDKFICKKEGPSGDAIFKFEPVGKSVYNEHHMFCSFYADIPNLPTFYAIGSNSNKPKLVFTKDNVQDEIVFGSDKMILWTPFLAVQTCDRDLVKSSTVGSPDNADTLWTEVDTLTDTPKCDTTSFVVVKNSGGTPVKTKKITCQKDADAFKWHYEATGGGAMTVIDEKFEVYCVQKLCQQCAKVEPILLPNCPTCTQAHLAPAATPATCPTLTCTAPSKFSLTGKDTIEGAAECKKLPASPTSAFGWFVDNVHLETASCLELKDCDKPGVTGDAKKITGLGSNSIKCTDDALSISYSAGTRNATSKTLECNKLTGLFKTTSGEDLPKSLTIECKEAIPESPPMNKPAAASAFLDDYGIPLGVVAGMLLLIAIAVVCYFRFDWIKDKLVKKKPEVSAKKTEKAVAGANKSTSSATSITAPGEVVDTSDGRKRSSKRSKRDSKKEKKEKKFKLEEHQTWDNETFVKKILPNFKTCEPEAKRLWLRDYLCRFYAYSNTKKTPESGTFNQFWLLVKQCCDDKCEDAGVWVELFNICFLIGYSIVEKNDQTDALRCHYMKPLECYMLEFLKKCDFYKRDNEPRSETEMRVICIMVLLHTRHPDVTETLRKLTFNEKQEVPLRMLTAACYTRERDDKGKTVQAQYKRVIDTSVLDPHTAEGWGTYLQHCAYGLGGYLITQTETFQYAFFDAIYQFPLQKEMNADRCFTPSDWLFAYKGAMLHENSAKVALGIFKQMNSGCLLHIEQLLKQQHKDDPDEIDKHRNQYKHDMKEYTQLLSELLIGEEEFKEFQPHLYFVLTFIGEKIAKKDEPLCEERIRERAINMYNMMRDRNFAKECTESLKAIGAKDV